MNDTQLIPNDLAACQTLIVEQARAVLEQSDEITKLKQVVEEQQLTINKLLQQAYRNRSERYREDPQQMQIDFGNTPEAGDAADGLTEAVQEAEIVIAEHSRRRHKPRKARNESLPAHLPRYEVTLEAPDEVTHCAEHGARKLIGYDAQETLEFERPKLKVRVTLIPKYVCEGQAECGVKEAPRAEGLVEGNRYDTSVAAEIITAKYGYHLPIYRQQDYFAGSGWTPSRGTLLNILVAAAACLRPLRAVSARASHRQRRAGHGRNANHLAPTAGDSRGNPRRRQVATDSRGLRQSAGRRAAERLGADVGLPQPDGAHQRLRLHRQPAPRRARRVPRGGEFYRHDDGGLLFGLSRHHTAERSADRTRRVQRPCAEKIFEARASEPLLASRFLAIYQELYDIEDRGKALPCAEREALRAAAALPAWQRLRELLDGEAVVRVLPKEKFAEALGYLRNQWDALQVYLDHGRLPIDNNETEQLMKQVAIGRKNWLFVGSVAAGARRRTSSQSSAAPCGTTWTCGPT